MKHATLEVARFWLKRFFYKQTTGLLPSPKNRRNFIFFCVKSIFLLYTPGAHGTVHRVHTTCVLPPQQVVICMGERAHPSSETCY